MAREETTWLAQDKPFKNEMLLPLHVFSRSRDNASCGHNAGRGRWRCINEAHIIEADLSSVKGGLTAFERDSVDPVRGTSTRGGLFHY